MVRFLADNSGMDISLLTFHGFNYDGKTILAKQVGSGRKRRLRLSTDKSETDHS